MTETEIDIVQADTLEAGDLIKVPDFGFVTVLRIDVDDAIVMVYTDVDPDDPFTYAWDDRITLYGYPDSED